MNDDLTKLMHEALDGAAPDPLLWNRVESAVSRKTLSRRIALGVAALAVPAAAFAAVTFLPSATPDRPDVAVDPAPTATPSSGATDTPGTDNPSYVAPIDLSPTVLAWVVDDNHIYAGDKDGNRTAEFVIGADGDGQQIVALAGRLDAGVQHLAAVVRSFDRDGAAEFRVDRLSWDSGATSFEGADHTEGRMFSQFDGAVYSAAFDNEGRLLVFSSPSASDGTVGVTTINFDGDLRVLAGRDVEVPTAATVRIVDVAGDDQAHARADDGTVLVVDLSNGTSYTTAYGNGSSWLFDGQASRLLFSSDEAIWVVREFPERSGMREIFLPFDAMALEATDLRLIEGPFGVTFLEYRGDVWRLADTEWVEVGGVSESATNITGFVAGAGLTRPVAPVDRSGWTADAVTTSTPIDEGGAGALEVGMTLAEARRVTGQDIVVTYDFDGFCINTRIQGVEGFSMTFLPAGEGPVAPQDAVLATVESFADRGSTGNPTREGVGPGMTVEDLLAAYPAAVESPNAYDPESSYWDVAFEDGLGIRFNTTPDGIIQSVYGGNDHRLALEGCA